MTEIQIGRGKAARRAYELAEVAIVPSRRTRDAADVDLSWKIDAYRLGLPLLAAGLSASLLPAGAAAVGARGAMGVVDLELLWNEHQDEGRLKDQIAEVKSGGARCAASVSPKRAAELVEHAIAAEVDLLMIRARIISAEHVSSTSEPLNLKTFIRSLDVPVVVGGCASYNAALHLMRTGAAGVLVGVAERGLGIDVPLATALADARAARVRHLDETSVYCHIIAAGAIESGLDVAKALAIGADAALIDAPLLATPSGDDVESVDQLLRRVMAKCGYTDVKAFQKAEVVVR